MLSFIPFRLLLLIAIFIISLLWLYFLSINVPSLNQRETEEPEIESHLKFPSNLEELQKVSQILGDYFQHNKSYVLLLFSSAYLFKQTFAIPGSVFMNLLSGALFGLKAGFTLACLLTATGATFCYLLSNFCGKSWISRQFSRQLTVLRRKVEDNRSSLIYYLLFLRLFPMTPNWFLNIASPIIGIPLHLFFISVFIGLMPYNFICVQTGCLLSTLKSMDDVFTWSTLLTLMGIAFVALIPGLLSRKLSKSKSRETLNSTISS
ncbi:transmembrane protein 41A [Tetranychus urticae]|uniref:transmembrane protein 41A n=1 Tax=Tetranychus urticae TaxID=32264 RepID=UPI00077BA7EA|nr:transmembrane protein 41A [Tetranychus urticae]